jgi:hypothetical protein
MQFIFLYHYYHAEEVYNSIRIMIYLLVVRLWASFFYLKELRIIRVIANVVEVELSFCA